MLVNKKKKTRGYKLISKNHEFYFHKLKILYDLIRLKKTKICKIKVKKKEKNSNTNGAPLINFFIAVKRYVFLLFFLLSFIKYPYSDSKLYQKILHIKTKNKNKNYSK